MIFFVIVKAAPQTTPVLSKFGCFFGNFKRLIRFFFFHVYTEIFWYKGSNIVQLYHLSWFDARLVHRDFIASDVGGSVTLRWTIEVIFHHGVVIADFSSLGGGRVYDFMLNEKSHVLSWGSNSRLSSWGSMRVYDFTLNDKSFIMME